MNGRTEASTYILVSDIFSTAAQHNPPSADNSAAKPTAVNLTNLRITRIYRHAGEYVCSCALNSFK